MFPMPELAPAAGQRLGRYRGEIGRHFRSKADTEQPPSDKWANS